MSKTVYFPLSSSFMALSMLGFFISIWLVPGWSIPWAFAFTFFFVIMFIASVVTMTKAEPITREMNELAIHEHHRKIKLSDHMNVSKKTPGNFLPKWYDALFIVFIVVAGYYIFQAITLSSALVNPVWFIIVMSIYILVMILLIVDIISSPNLVSFWQVLYVMFILLLGPIGMFIYYFYKRATGK